MGVLEAENLIERLNYRKEASATGTKKFIKMKGKRAQMDHAADQSNPNAKIGFKSTMYSVTESSGHVEVTIVKKVNEEMAFIVKT